MNFIFKPSALCFCLILLFQSLSSKAEGVGSGGGGSSLDCSSNNRLGLSVGHHPLDYVLAKRNMPEKIWAFTMPNITKEIIMQLLMTAPDLGNQFQSFLDIYLKKESTGYEFDDKIVWRKASDGNLHLSDEALKEPLPEGCKGPYTVVRKIQIGSQIVYQYDENILKQFEANPQDLSWILTHEWLRDYLKDPEMIRTMNTYLHSKDFFGHSSERVVQVLKNLGMGSYVTATSVAYRNKIESALKGFLSTVKPRKNNSRLSPEEIAEVANTLHDAQATEQSIRDLAEIVVTDWYSSLVLHDLKSQGLNPKVLGDVEIFIISGERLLGDLKLHDDTNNALSRVLHGKTEESEVDMIRESQFVELIYKILIAQ